MASTIPSINRPRLGCVSPEIAAKKALEGDRDSLMANTIADGLEAARVDIEALQSGGGSAGKNAYTVSVEGTTWGNAGETLYLTVATGTVDWMGFGAWIFISDGVHYGTATVQQVGAEDPEFPGTQIVVLLDHSTPGNPEVGTVIASGATVSPSGRPA